MSGLVASEEAWRGAMDDVRAWESSVYTTEQLADAEYYGWRTVQDTASVLAAALD